MKPSSHIRLWGVLCHLSVLTYLAPLSYLANLYLSYFRNRVGVSFPLNLVLWLLTAMVFLWFTPHYGIWISQRKIHPFIDRQGREIKRFQMWTAKWVLLPWLVFVFALHPFVISWIIPHIAKGFLSPSVAVALGSLLLGMLIGLSYLTIALVSLILVICHLFQIVVAADKASKGELYLYPVGRLN
jgi:uncharacterized Tic20 family protein